MKTRTALFTLVFLFVSSPLLAQQATVKRSSILRSDSSSSSQALEHVKAGAIVTLVDEAAQNGYYHVTVADGQAGWVWARNVATSGAQQPATGSPSTSDNSGQCDETLWDHVYNPQRLIVQQKCIVVTGTIVDATNGQHADGVRHEADGDTHGWLQVDSQFASLLNDGNKTHEGGNLVFEIVCKFPVTQADAVASCPASYQSPVNIPPVGSHVRIVGSYVQDANHAKWMEIHPVTLIEVIPTP